MRQTDQEGTTGVTTRPHTQPQGWAIGTARFVIKPVLSVLARRRWTGTDHIPVSGGAVLVINHISHVDPLVIAHYVHDLGRLPRYLGKAGLWRNKFLRPLLENARQIPVERLSDTAAGAFDAAVAAVEAGELVVIYPEGTITRDPDLWPMVGKSGAARVALSTHCPVIPVGQWGAQELMAPYSGSLKVSRNRPLLQVAAGEPIDLSDLYDQPVTAQTIAEATGRIMAAITDIVADLRHETPPGVRFDPRLMGVREIGNPNLPADPPHDQSDQQHTRQEGDA